MSVLEGKADFPVMRSSSRLILAMPAPRLTRESKNVTTGRARVKETRATFSTWPDDRVSLSIQEMGSPKPWVAGVGTPPPEAAGSARAIGSGGGLPTPATHSGLGISR